MSHRDPEAPTIRAILSPFVPISRELMVLLSNPRALIGGILGTAALTAALWTLVLIPQASADETAAEALDLEFIPGALVRQGEKIDPERLPEKLIVEPTVAAEEPTADKVTRDDSAEPPPEEAETDDRPEPPHSKEKPDPNKRDATKSDKNRETNKQFKTDLPTVKELPGEDPFGSPSGWADMAKDGDPWATAVIGALNRMKIPSYAALQKGGVYRFRITICANGTIRQVQQRRSTGDKTLDATIRTAVATTRIPLPPANVAKQLKGGCRQIPYEFTWSDSGEVR